MASQLSRLFSRALGQSNDTDGQTRLKESDHTIVLGWGPHTPLVVEELAAAGDIRRRSSIVVMAEEDRSRMEAALWSRLRPSAAARVLCRTGQSVDAHDLDLLAPERARAIVLLPGAGEHPDPAILQTIFALANSSQRRQSSYHIVAAFQDSASIPLARALAGSSRLDVVLVDDLVARIVAQTCMQPGLSLVFDELLTYAGNEVYVTREPALVGLTFGEALYCFETSIPIGLQSALGEVRVLPPMDTRITPEHELIALSAGQNTIKISLASGADIHEDAVRSPRRNHAVPQRLLLLGWNGRASMLLKHLDACATPGSGLTVVFGSHEDQTASRSTFTSLKHLALTGLGADDEGAAPEHLLSQGFDRIIVLSDGSEESSARTSALAHRLRHSAWRSDRPFSIVSETSDTGDRASQFGGMDDVIAIDRLVGLMVSQVADSPARAAVFADLLDAEGAEIKFRPADDYVALDAATTFYTVIESARRRQEIAIGYRGRRPGDRTGDRLTMLNPDKQAAIWFGVEDRVIVLTNQ